jgi:hypothetical protein
MKDYRQFLKESLLTEELTPTNDTQFYTAFVSWLSQEGYATIVDSDDPVKNYSIKKETKDTIHIQIETVKDFEREQAKQDLVSFLKEYFDTESDAEGPWKFSTGNHGSMGRIEISKKFTGNDKNVWIKFKYLKKTIDVQEVLTAALVLLGDTYSEVNIPLTECDKILEKVQGIVGNVEGQGDKKKEILDGIKSNYIDLAPSISSSNAILEAMSPQTPTKAYWTGKTWHKDIKMFNPEEAEKSFKNYNPSDIVIKGSGANFYGFSLKKKLSAKTKNPTLLNKPATGNDSMLKNILDPDELKVIDDAREAFFRKVLIYNEEPNEKLQSKNKTVKKLQKMNTRALFGVVSNTDKSIFSAGLKNQFFDNQFFKTIADAVPKGDGKRFMQGFFDMAFRTKMKELVPNTTMIDDVVTDLSEGRFDFWLNTGIGRKLVNSIQVEPANMKDLDTTISVISDLMSNKELRVQLNKNKTQAYEIPKGEEGAAKIFFTITLNGKVLVEIEVRYKGSFTPAPQFQASTTPAFDALFKKVV